MTTPDPYKECVECGKFNYNYRRRKTCWLCNSQLDGDRTRARPRRKPTTQPTTQPTVDEDRSGDSVWTLIAAGIAVLLSFVGLIMIDAGGIAFASFLLLMPATIATFFRMSKRKRRGETTTVIDKVLVFVSSFFLSIICIILLFVAAIIALFVICVAVFAGIGTISGGFG